MIARLPVEIFLVPATVLTLSLSAFDAARVAVDAVAPPVVEGSGVYGRPVLPGQVVMVDWTIVKRTNCPGHVSRVWSGGAGFYLAEPYSATALPQSDEPLHYRIPTQIPRRAPGGDLMLRIVGQYQCPGQEPERFELGPVAFEVTK